MRKIIGVCVLVNLLMMAVLLALLHVYPTSPRVVSFDLKGTVNLFSEQLAGDNLSQDAQSKAISSFSNALNQATQDYASTHHVVILTSPSVIAGAEDVTPAIQTLTAKLEQQQQGASHV